MLPLDPNKPIVFEKSGRALKPELIEIFFRHGFAPAERKFKTIFLVMATTGLRIAEVCAIELRDFVPNTNFQQVRIKLEKKIKANTIVPRILPEAGAAILRAWIRDNWHWICSKGGYIFPSTNNRSYHIRPNNVETWLSKRRKELDKQFPDIGFLDIAGFMRFKNPKFNHYTGKYETEKPMYKLCCHSFRHFFATHISPDPEKAYQILRHNDIRTTLQYRKEADIIQLETRLANELFNEQFFDAVNNPAENVIAIWDNLKDYPNTP